MYVSSREHPPTFDTSKHPNLVGLSLSLCIKDVIQGKVSVEQIDSIIANTKCETEAHWNEVFEIYCRLYWEADPERAVRIVRTLVKLGKIEQPRIKDNFHHHFYPYHWQPKEDLTRCDA